MQQKNWTIGVAAVLVFMLVASGAAAVAAGTKDNPLTSQSYLVDEFQPQLMKKISEKVDAELKAKTEDIKSQITNLSASVDQRLTALSGIDAAGLVNNSEFVAAVAAEVIKQLPASGNAGGAGYQKVEIDSGKSVTLGIGTMVVLRVGSAKVFDVGDVGLVDLTTAETLKGKGDLKISHNYLCTIEASGDTKARGFTTTAKVTVFISGAYTIA